MLPQPFNISGMMGPQRTIVQCQLQRAGITQPCEDALLAACYRNPGAAPQGGAHPVIMNCGQSCAVCPLSQAYIHCASQHLQHFTRLGRDTAA